MYLSRGEHIVEKHVFLAEFLGVLEASLEDPLLAADLPEDVLSKVREALDVFRGHAGAAARRGHS